MKRYAADAIVHDRYVAEHMISDKAAAALGIWSRNSDETGPQFPRDSLRALPEESIQKDRAHWRFKVNFSKFRFEACGQSTALSFYLQYRGLPCDERRD